MSRITVTLIASATILLSACGHVGAGAAVVSTPTASADSGVQGTVMVGPSSPVSSASAQPTGQPVAVQIEVWSASQGNKKASPQPATTIVARGASDASGRFRIALPPGQYRLTPVSNDPQLRAVSVDVTVQAHQFVTVVLELDNGLR
jgi:hypothetical protein